jgi:hypothetical protein
MRNGDILLLPAVWPVRLTPEQQVELGERLLVERCQSGNVSEG